MPERDRKTDRPPERPGARALTVLIVDDDLVAREVARRVAAAIPAVAVQGEAESGERALEWLDKRMADVVLMDWSMPGIDGVEATTRAIARCPGVRVVGWTSVADPVLHAGFRAAGAVEVLLKSDLVGLRRFLGRLAGESGAAD
jgi:DNA-binding NarL/FixJ family response regulator